MISDELRKKKPYAVAVQSGDSQLRDLEVKLEKAMKNAGMTVVGEQFGNHVTFTIIVSSEWVNN